MEASCRLNVNLFMNKNYSLIADQTITIIIIDKQEDVIECSENNIRIRIYRMLTIATTVRL